MRAAVVHIAPFTRLFFLCLFVPGWLSRGIALPADGVRSLHLPAVGERPVHEGGVVLLCRRGSKAGFRRQQEASAGGGRLSTHDNWWPHV